MAMPSNSDVSKSGLVEATKVATGASLVTGAIVKGAVASPQPSKAPPAATSKADSPTEFFVPLEQSRVAPRKPSAEDLARSLQRELKRVGCYDDAITQEWTETAKLAMRAFNAKVNAKLPVDAPDHILLTLVSGHKGRACDKPCSTASKGRNCLPSREEISTEAQPLHRTSFVVAHNRVEPQSRPRVEAAAPPPVQIPAPQAAKPEASPLPVMQDQVTTAVIKGVAQGQVVKAKPRSSKVAAASQNSQKGMASKAGTREGKPPVRVASAAENRAARPARTAERGFDGKAFFHEMSYRGS